jgi:hypothetical protein
MNSPDRDLLVLTKKTKMNEQELEHEVTLLNGLLYNVENLQTFCSANEIIDLNRCRIIEKPHLIQKAVQKRKLKPFVFICGKN